MDLNERMVDPVAIMIRNSKQALAVLIISLLITLFDSTCKEPVSPAEFRVVSLSPAMTEILFALGAGDRIVGVTTYCDYPEQTKNIIKVGDFSNPAIERIVRLKPTLVIVNLPEQMRIKKELDKLKINIFVSSPNSLDDLYREIAEIAKLIKKEGVADSLIRYMKRAIKPRNQLKKRVYIELSPRPIITIGAQSFLNELVQMAGAENIFSDIDKNYPVVSQEEVIKRDPEVIIQFHPEDIKKRLGWQSIKAIKTGKVYANLNQDQLLRPGPRLVLGFKELTTILEGSD